MGGGEGGGTGERERERGGGEEGGGEERERETRKGEGCNYYQTDEQSSGSHTLYPVMSPLGISGSTHPTTMEEADTVIMVTRGGPGGASRVIEDTLTGWLKPHPPSVTSDSMYPVAGVRPGKDCVQGVI